MGQCRDCAWWAGKPRAWKFQTCYRFSEDRTGRLQGAGPAAAAVFGEGTPGWFVTLRTFGCTEFTPREES